MNKELKEQAYKELRDRFFTTPEGHTAIIASWSKGEQEVYKRIEDLIDSLIDKTVQMTEERIVGIIWMKHFDCLCPQDELCFCGKAIKDDIISLITNKSDINK